MNPSSLLPIDLSHELFIIALVYDTLDNVLTNSLFFIHQNAQVFCINMSLLFQEVVFLSQQFLQKI